MKRTYYEVRMLGCIAYVSALNEQEAIILAQAEAIQEGMNYELVSIYGISIEEFIKQKRKEREELESK
ncbi:hypothetical protein [Paenibacillus xylanexedens]|uniref:hypothetical protein n=1 Tax=Paenibacillus xylanexedens TaxID=528191 RepID=UPI0011A1D620|nr:hypothetical protein [Paenibacillus xylanexedens]